ncbi:MAG TPA: hypothetical protein VFN38_00755, partial [Gemmatimonadaceae bacterium]|nr:hypothetical protein [Gemmatimonadaceae bacterium]
MTPAHPLTRSLSTLRRQWRTRVALEAAVWIVAAALLAAVAGHVVTSAFGTSATTVLVARLIGYSLVAAAAGFFLALPLVRRTSDQRFALYVEE